MTLSSHSEPLPVDDLDDAVDALRASGLRVSAARRLMLEALFAAGGPVSADAIAGGLDGRVPRSDLATVYRGLEALEQIGLVRHVHLGHGPGLYALATRGREYLVCESCGDVQAVRPGELEGTRETIRETFGFRASFRHFPLVGLCAACGGETPTRGVDPRA
jgi:Fur family transcriptional regulator, ferric uptake regulator